MSSDSGPLASGRRVPLPVDTHLHLSLGGDPLVNAARQLAAGVAAVRDAGDRDGCLEGVEWPAPLNVIRTGPALFKPGFYGSFIGDNRDLSLAEKIAAAPDGFVKVLLTGLVSFDEYGRVGPRQWSFAELEEIVQLAAAAGRRVMVHVNSDAACRDAVKAGVSSIEHGYFIAPETLKMMADKGIFWTPTVAAMANQASDPAGRFSPAQVEIIERNYQRHLEMIALAHELGVRLTIGTDSGSYNVPHGPSYLREMELFVAAGIAASEVLQIAALNGRQLLGLPVEPLLEVGDDCQPSKFLELSAKVLAGIQESD